MKHNYLQIKKTIFKPKNKKLNKIDKTNVIYNYCLKWYNYRKVSTWFSTLKQEDITEKEFKHAQNVWKTYNCNTLKDYHNLYLKTDVLILADAFEKFRDFFLKHHQIDPCYCFSAPGLTWECGFKYTGIKLELFTDYDNFLMFEKGIRGGYSGVLGPRHVKSFNKYLKDFDKNKRSNYLLYLDANNLYGWAMSQPLPTGDFKWEDNPDYYKNIPKGRGCIVECDLEYTTKAKINTRKFPLAPEHMIAEKEMLSEHQVNLLEKLDIKLGKEKKLFLTLFDKKKYVIHHELLKYYESLGLKVTKVHRTNSFKESAWLKPYIDFNTNQRTKAKSNFEKDLWKLMNNTFYGKTMENIRNRHEVKLCNDENEVKKFINKPNFKDSIIFNENLVGIINNITSIKFNKPIYLGQVILDYSKLLMYKFYYETINDMWPDNEIIGFDTDSFFLNIYTDDVYKDMKYIRDELDTSDYPKDHPLYSTLNKKVIGKFKDELNGKIMTEIIFLKSKAYSFKFLNYNSNNLNEINKLKSVSKPIIEKDINFNIYYNCLYEEEIQLNTMYRLNSEKHDMFINEVQKVSMNPFDNKRFFCKNNIKTLSLCDPVSSILFEMVETVKLENNFCSILIMVFFYHFFSNFFFILKR